MTDNVDECELHTHTRTVKTIFLLDKIMIPRHVISTLDGIADTRAVSDVAG